MINYIIRRLLMFVPIIFGVAFVFFLLFNVVGGQEKFLYNILPEKSRSPEMIERYREQYGLNDPAIVQYLNMVKRMITFDFGRSETRKVPVTRLIKKHVPASMMLTFPAFTMQIIISLSVSLLAVYNRGRLLDRALTVMSVIGMSLSMLIIIMLGQYFFAYKLGLFPISGWAKGFKVIQYLILPWMMWIFVSVGYDVRFFRTTLVEEYGRDYVRTARSKGVSERNIMIKHVLRNALIPIITYVVISIPFLLTGSLLLEKFFSIPGMGDLMVGAILSYDFPVLQATVMFYTIFFVVFSLLSDILYGLVDPRVRYD